MAIRMRWDFQTGTAAKEINCSGKTGFPKEDELFLSILEQNRLTVNFQPIFSLSDTAVTGYEALSRLTVPNGFKNIENFFETAAKYGRSDELDRLCVKNILNHKEVRNKEESSMLFINISPDSFCSEEKTFQMLDLLKNCSCLKNKSLTIEITEKTAIKKYRMFKKAVSSVRDMGCMVAIDDFGAGFGGLKMLSIIEPDYIKIDRHLISDIDDAIIKYNLVNSIVTACHRIGIKVIAEGIETMAEMQTCADMGIELIQGYFIGKPDPKMVKTEELNIKGLQKNTVKINGTETLITDIATFIEPLAPEDSVKKALEYFNQNKRIQCIPIVKNRRLCGMLNRHRFMEYHLVGPYGYGYHLNYYKKIKDIMEKSFLQVEYNLTPEDVSRQTRFRSYEMTYDDIFITQNGFYYGVVPVQKLLQAITEKSITMAKGSNPLTGLPGNEFIQMTIEKNLNQSMHMDICYIDIDNFKPYNDCYGFEKGDMVLKKLGEIANHVVRELSNDTVSFAGHIGGDDFILVVRPRHSIKICETIIKEFENLRPLFHGRHTFKLGCYYSIDRQGEKREFSLLSLSIGIVSTEVYKFRSYAEVASVASEVKHKAKTIQGSSIVRDRRLCGSKSLSCIGSVSSLKMEQSSQHCSAALFKRS